MARNDIYLNIDATTPAAAVVTGQQDMTVATFPDLVLGDTPTFNFRFTDNTVTPPSWAGNAQYQITWAISDAISQDVGPYALQTQATPISGGWSMVLPLNTGDLIGAINRLRISQEYPVARLWQQIRVTDPSGYLVTYGLIRTNVRLRTISDSQQIPDSPLPTGTRYVLVDAGGTLVSPSAATFFAQNGRTASYNAQSNANGNSDVQPATNSIQHTEIITFSGSAGERNVLLKTAGRMAGDICNLRVTVPATSGIVIHVHNENKNGTLLSQLTTDTTGDDAAFTYVYTGSAWTPFTFAYPA